MYRFRTKLDYVKYTDIEIRIFKYLELVTILTDSNNRLYVLLLKFIFYIGRPNKDLQYEKAFVRPKTKTRSIQSIEIYIYLELFLTD